MLVYMKQMEKEDLEAYSKTKMEIGFLIFMANSYAPQASFLTTAPETIT